MSTERARAELAKIHIAKAQLGLDDDAYRTLLQQVAGVRSSRDLDARGRALVLSHFERCGFVPKPKRKAGRAPHGGRSKKPLLGKLTALLTESGKPYAYADGMARHMFGVSAVAFLTKEQLYKVVQALSVQQRREQQRAAASAASAPEPCA